MEERALQSSGFSVGCNYWASHAGTAMWRDWREDAVGADFSLLSSSGLKLVRVFPLWPDFQPIVALRGFGGDLIEYRLGDAEIPMGRDAVASLDPVMVARLLRLCELATEHRLQLIVGLVTGWMSGRLFMPPALEGLNPITSPVALAWQARLVEGLVRVCAEQPAILAWDLGNECNCMGRASNSEEAYHWTATISHAIRATDPTRPIISGMHALSVQPRAAWRIEDQGVLTDLLTTHPYPHWVEHGRLEALSEYRTTLLPTIETCLYRDLGGKPCFAEEIGSMGPMVASDETAASWLRANLLSLWAHDGRGLLWWCAFDQTHLAHAPYDWMGIETELGLFGAEGAPKPAAAELIAFSRWLDDFPKRALPPRTIDAVCVLSRDQDSWAAAIGSFALAKQTGLEIAFRFADQEWPEAPILLVPCLTGPAPLRRSEWNRVRECVRSGATVYISLHDGIVPEFTETTGLRVLTRNQRANPTRVVDASGPAEALEVRTGDQLVCEGTTAEILLRADSGAPVYARNRYGDGTVFTLLFPLEAQLALTAGALAPSRTGLARRIYASFARAKRACRISHPGLGLTEHSCGPERVLCFIINYTDQAIDAAPEFAPGWREVERWRGRGPPGQPSYVVPGHDGLIVLLERPAG